MSFAYSDYMQEMLSVSVIFFGRYLSQKLGTKYARRNITASSQTILFRQMLHMANPSEYSGMHRTIINEILESKRHELKSKKLSKKCAILIITAHDFLQVSPTLQAKSKLS